MNYYDFLSFCRDIPGHCCGGETILQLTDLEYNNESQTYIAYYQNPYNTRIKGCFALDSKTMPLFKQYMIDDQILTLKDRYFCFSYDFDDYSKEHKDSFFDCDECKKRGVIVTELSEIDSSNL